MPVARYAPRSMRILLVSANREQLPSPVVPIGVLSVAAAVRDAHDVEVKDLCFDDDACDALAEAVVRFSPDVVGIGLRNLHTNAYDGMDRLIDEYAALVQSVRRASSGRDVTIVLGGSGYSLQPETLLDRLGGDFGVVGEGERTFRDLVDALARGETPPRIVRARSLSASGSPSASTAGVSLVTLGRRPPGTLASPREGGESELDRLPLPARDLTDPRYYAFEGTENFQTKRGCAFTCAYCDYPDLEGRKVRVRDPARVADEVLARSKVPGVSHAFFVDSVFNVPRSHAIAVCDALAARGNPLPWVCYGSPVAFDEEVVAAMARARCIGVEIGSDAGTERMLERLRKPFRLDDIRETRRLFAAHGIFDCHTFVLGALDETADEAKETLAFVDELDPDVAVFIVFMEDRESMTVHRARHRDAILRLLAEEAPKRPGWVVPELGIRFGDKLTGMVRRFGLRGPSWTHLATVRRFGPEALGLRARRDAGPTPTESARR